MTTTIDETTQIVETAKCFRSCAHFIVTYCQIEDPIRGEWIPFDLWPEQRETLSVIDNNLLVVMLKARQLGLTWLVLAFALWLMLFRPLATVLLFSRRDTEAVYLLDDRLKGMFERLPDWLRYGIVPTSDSAHEFSLSNGSTARAFPTTAGDAYTATLAIVDEADLVPNLNLLMRAVKPTIDNGGRMLLLSRSNKSEPQSEFKRIYRAAKQELNDWVAVFLPWFVHPARDAAWYDAQRRDIEQRTGSVDDLHEQYPATDDEALAPRTLDKRIAPKWIRQCYDERWPIGVPNVAPSIPNLRVFALPQPGRRYVIGADPAEGNPTSDDSALTVLDADTGEECANVAGRIQPAVFASHIDNIGRWFNNASALVERNNHGHAVLLWLRDNSRLRRLMGHDGKPGWHSTSKGKTLLYDACAEAFRNEETTLHDFATMTQLQSIEGSSLRAPEGERDDLADSYALAIVAKGQRPRQSASSFQG